MQLNQSMTLYDLISFLFQENVKSGLAYLDPGTGSYLIQVLIATIVGVLFVVKHYWQKIKLLFTHKTKGGLNQELSNDNDPEDTI